MTTTTTETTPSNGKGKATTESAHDAFMRVRKDIAAQVVERDEALDALLVAALSGEHIVLLGPPGEAKSMLSRLFCAAVQGAEFFEYLMTRFSTPDEFLGPFSLKALQEDRFQRNVTGRLPEAVVAFLDEVFKANSAALNSLLPVLNERVYFDDGQRKRIPVRTVVGASNELPQKGEGLEALYDRFLFRLFIDTIQDDGNFMRMLGAGEPRTTETITLEQWDQALAEVQAVTVPQETLEAIARLRNDMRAAGFNPSSRRWRKALKALKAQAWLDGETEVTDDHFPVLNHIMWDEPEQRAELAGVVARAANPLYAEALEKHDAVMDLVNSLGAKPTRDQQAVVLSELKTAGKKVKAVRDQARKGSRVEKKIQSLLDNLRTEHDAIRKRLMDEWNL